MDINKFRESGSILHDITLEQMLERKRREFNALKEHQASIGNVYVLQYINFNNAFQRQYISWMMEGDMDVYFYDKGLVSDSLTKITKKETTVPDRLCIVIFIPKTITIEEFQKIEKFILNRERN
jgi:hypothetical protein